MEGWEGPAWTINIAAGDDKISRNKKGSPAGLTDGTLRSTKSRPMLTFCSDRPLSISDRWNNIAPIASLDPCSVKRPDVCRGILREQVARDNRQGRCIAFAASQSCFLRGHVVYRETVLASFRRSLVWKIFQGWNSLSRQMRGKDDEFDVMRDFVGQTDL